jgi:uncharacterized protein YndB with AHSA1/START domain
MTTIHHRIPIDAPVENVYEVISTAEGIGTWWDKQIPVKTDLGLVLVHNPGPEHGAVKMRVVERVLNTRVEWECISEHPKSSPASAWTGTRFMFDLIEADGSPEQGRDTILDFRQTGYDEKSEFFESNRAAWGEVLGNLKRVVESNRS